MKPFDDEQQNKEAEENAKKFIEELEKELKENGDNKKREAAKSTNLSF